MILVRDRLESFKVDSDHHALREQASQARRKLAHPVVEKSSISQEAYLFLAIRLISLAIDEQLSSLDPIGGRLIVKIIELVKTDTWLAFIA